MNHQPIYFAQPGMQPNFYVMPHGQHVRAPFAYMQYPQIYNNQFAAPAANYGQMAAPTSNGQQRQAAPQAAAPTMAPQANEYTSYPSMEVYTPSVMQSAPVPAQVPPPAPTQKTAKKPGSKALLIINPNTGKSIFDDDLTTAGSGGSAASNSSSIATVDKAITASHNELNNKDEAVEKEAEAAAEPSTPVVSAMSDGPSVDITPKHQVNKLKKVKPPEPAVVVPIVPVAEPVEKKPIVKVEKEVEAVPEAVVVVDSENNNTTSSVTVVEAPVAQVEETPKPVPVAASTTVVVEKKEVHVKELPVPSTTTAVDINDTTTMGRKQRNRKKFPK
jgi:hypothetical protein